MLYSVPQSRKDESDSEEEATPQNPPPNPPLPPPNENESDDSENEDELDSFASLVDSDADVSSTRDPTSPDRDDAQDVQQDLSLLHIDEDGRFLQPGQIIRYMLNKGGWGVSTVMNMSKKEKLKYPDWYNVKFSERGKMITKSVKLLLEDYKQTWHLIVPDGEED